MNNDREELFFQMAASAHWEDESEQIEEEIAAFHQNHADFSAPQILETALVALQEQQAAKQKAAQHRKTMRRMKMVAGIVLAIGITGMTLVTTVDAMRVAVTNFFIDTFDEYTTVHLQEEPADETPDTTQSEEPSGTVEINWKNAYAPTILPEGYELSLAESLNDSMRFLVYSHNNSEKYISLDQLTPGSTINVNTEGVEIHKITIHGNKGFWFHQQDYIMVVWNNTQYVFVLDVPDSVENFIEIAESVKIIN